MLLLLLPPACPSIQQDAVRHSKYAASATVAVADSSKSTGDAAV
jgi:hypothetical protein